MRFTKVAAAAALATGAVLGTAGPALAAGGHSTVIEPAGPEISWVKDSVIVRGNNPDEAIVQAKYRCEGAGVHLWASVKQGPDLDVATGHTGSAYADSWYETPEGPMPICDGRTHVVQYTLSRSTEDDFERLEDGQALLQFVFFYVDRAGNPHRAGYAAWVDVKTP